ncbi:MAG TPA: NADH-quinone oxidoreductase subunit N [Candidatus Hypogeohydataceae bacterium YC41]
MEIIFPAVNIASIAPQLIVATFAILALLVEVFSKSSRLVFATCLVGLFVAFALSFMQWGRGIPYENSLVAVDNYTTFFNALFAIVAIITMLLSLGYVDNTGIDTGKYYPLILFATLGMMLLVSSMDLLLMFLSLELLSISMYVLVGSQRDRWVSSEAAIKYILTGAFASGFLLFGIALVYGATGTISFTKLESLLSGLTGEGLPLLKMGVLLMMVGLGFKIAMVPFHMWAPDVYEGAPTPITGFLSTGSKIAAFALILRLFNNPFNHLFSDWVGILWILAVLSMTIGNVAALLQKNVKRMLAYSSIAHVGYLLVAFIALSTRAMEAVVLYFTLYAIMGLTAFGCITSLTSGEKERLKQEDYTSLGYTQPVQAVILSVCLLSLAGIPLTAGFIGKFYLFSSAVDAGYVGLAVIAVLNSAVSLYYYLGLMLRMYALPGRFAPVEVPVGSPVGKIVLLLLGFSILALGIYPSPLVGVVKGAVTALSAL